MSTRFQIIEKLQKRFNVAARTIEEFRLKTKPLSRKKLRQLMPLNRNLSGYALAAHGHKAGKRRRVLSPTVYKYSALDGFYVVKPRRIVN
ncbi:MAG: hypothetical protein ACJ71S_06125 [Acidobacteriaceae bacterium]